MMGAVDPRPSYGAFKFTSCFAGDDSHSSSDRAPSAQLKGAPGAASFGNMEILFFNGGASSDRGSYRSRGGGPARGSGRLAARQQTFGMDELGSCDDLAARPKRAAKLKGNAPMPRQIKRASPPLVRAPSPLGDANSRGRMQALMAEPSDSNAVYDAYAALVAAVARRAEHARRTALTTVSFPDHTSALSSFSGCGK
jgi:hypothetical protein